MVAVKSFRYGDYKRPYESPIVHARIDVIHSADGFIVETKMFIPFPVEILPPVYRPGSWLEYEPLYRAVVDVRMIRMGYELIEGAEYCPMHRDLVHKNWCRRCLMKSNHLKKQRLEEGLASLP